MSSKFKKSGNGAQQLHELHLNDNQLKSFFWWMIENDLRVPLELVRYCHNLFESEISLDK